MPIYTMRCDGCQEVFDVDRPIADGPARFGDEVGHLCDSSLTQIIHAPVIHGIGASGARRDWSRVRTKDTDAYRRLRKDKVQPPRVEGSAEIEQRAGTKFEVEQDVVYENRKAANRAQALSDDLS